MVTDPRKWAVIVVALACTVYLTSLWNGFVYDDVRVILDRPDVQSLANWKSLLTTGWRPNSLYRPLTKISLALDWAASGGAAWYFHLVNILLHGAVTLGVWVLSRRWIGLIGATVAAALFAVHPVHVEAVANVVGRAEVMATLFALMAAVLYRLDGELAENGVTDRRRFVTAFGTIGCTVLGLASKESAFAIPGLLLLVDWLESKRSNQSLEQRVKAHGVLWIAVVAITAEWLVLRGMVLGGLAGDDPAPGLYGEGLLGRAIIMAPIVLHYVRLLVFPYALSADYSPDFVSASTSLGIPFLAGVVTLGVLIWAGYRLRNTFPAMVFGLAWIGVSLFIVSNLIVPTGVMLAERSMYLPSVGLVFIVGEIAHVSWDRRKQFVVGAVTLLAIAGAARVVTRIPVWRTNEVFFPQLVKDAPGSFRATWVAGQLAFVAGDPVRGEALLRDAIRAYPVFANTWQSLGQRLEMQGRWAESAQAFSVAFRLAPERSYDAASAITNHVRAGRLDSAEAVAARALEEHPTDFRVLTARGDLAFAWGRPLEALTWRRRAAIFSNDSPFYWYLDGLAAIEAGFCPELSRSISKLELIDPKGPRGSELRDSLEVSTACQ
jgi:hypothetical protein